MKTLFFILLLFITGCSLPPPQNTQTDIKNITKTLPLQWTWTVEQARGEKSINWWQDYGNLELNHLVKKSLENNYSLKAAGFSVQQAKLGRERQALQQSPLFSGNISVNSNTDLEQIHLQNSYSQNIGVSYIIDYLGKNMLTMGRKAAEIKATGEDVKAAQQTVAGAVVNRFLKIAYLNDRLKLNADQLKFARKNKSFADAKYQTGIISKLDLLQFQQPILQLEQQREQFKIEKKEQQTALAAILGETRPIDIEPKGLESLTLVIPKAGIPAHLLAQRPDLRAAQYRLEQSMADIDIAKRNFYPQITLGSSVGNTTNKLLHILKNPTLALSTGLDLPFLQHQEKVLARKQTEIAYQQALNEFQQKLVEALSEAQQALLGLEKVQNEEKFLRKKQQEAREIEQLTRIKYQAGAVSLQTLLEKEEDRRREEEALLNNYFQQLEQSVRLHLALGGELQD